MRYLLISLLVTLCVQSAAAQDFEIDKRHSQVIFQVERFGFSKVTGVFSDVSGVISLDQEAPEESSVTATIATPVLFTGDEERDGHVSGDFWLNTTAFPEITFKSTGLDVQGAQKARLEGILTVLGESQPVVLDVVLNRMGMDPATKKQAVGFSASTRLKRSLFGLDTAMKLVSDDVFITLEILAHQSS